MDDLLCLTGDCEEGEWLSLESKNDDYHDENTSNVISGGLSEPKSKAFVKISAKLKLSMEPLLIESSSVPEKRK